MPVPYVQVALNEYLSADLEERIAESHMRDAEKNGARDVARAYRLKACDLCFVRSHIAMDLLAIGIDVGEWS
jgi:hypothetical protein